MDMPTRDMQTVAPSGEVIRELIHGVKMRSAITQLDERGTLCEIFNPTWDFVPFTPAHVYIVSFLPGIVKGWAVHYEQEDLYFFNNGRLLTVLYDDRKESPTYGKINELYFSEYNRGLLNIPPGIYHATKNVGTVEATLINLPNKLYNYSTPDKYRLPVENDYIPYRFENGLGW
jgi:dTDP-4-dehydrorhamnose 3,5-epimerase